MKLRHGKRNFLFRDCFGRKKNMGLNRRERVCERAANNPGLPRSLEGLLGEKLEVVHGQRAVEEGGREEENFLLEKE